MRLESEWPRDEAIELCLEVLATGCIYGVSPNHPADALADKLARHFTQVHCSPYGMVRDWGLIEAHFGRDDPDGEWKPMFFMVQAHRMKKPPKWKRLRAELVAVGHEFIPGTYAWTPAAQNADYHTVVASNGQACVDQDKDYPEHLGRAVKISAHPEPVPYPASKMPYESTRQALRAIAAAPESTWDGWLEKRQPAADDVVWLIQALGTLVRDEPARADEWTAFGLWLFTHSRTTAVWSAAEWAWRWAEFVRERQGVVPVGEVARVCLEALPMTPAEAAALPRQWREIAPADVRRLRLTHALLRQAFADVEPAPAPPGMAEWAGILALLR